MSSLPRQLRLFRFLGGTTLLGLTTITLVLPLGFGSGTPSAQAAAVAKKTNADGKKAAEPENIDLTTNDDLELKATFYPGTKGQESIPVIVIHGLGAKCNRLEYAQKGGLAEFLQSTLGCAVIVPDLRGHGKSVNWSEALQKKLRAAGKPAKQPLKAEKLKPADREAMLQEDLRAVKDFLWEKNNKKELNIDKLMVIGVEDGCAVALGYAAADSTGYEYHAAKYGPLKLGNFLKALVLISPQTTRITGLNAANQVLRDPEYRDLRNTLSVMILAGNQNATYFSEAERLQKVFAGGRPKLNSGQKVEDLTVWFYSKVDTKLQGANLLAEASLKVPDSIANFVETRLIKNPDAQDWSWKVRKAPHE